ncbi:hypothetical protein Tco_0919952 [Tanacetum coccineum]
MTEPTMEEYTRKTREDYGSGVARLKFDKDAKFELKDVTQDQIMLCVFHISLTGAASRWLRNKLVSSITTWKNLKGKFLSTYCLPSRTAKRMEEINNFQQEPDETLYQAWERFMELLLRCPQQYLTSMPEVILFYKRLDVPTRQILDSKGGMPTRKAYEAKKAIEEMADILKNGTMGHLLEIKDCPLKDEGKTLEEAYYTQFGVPFSNARRYRAAALGFYQRDNGNPSYQERSQTIEESLSKFMAKLAKRHDENSSLIKEIRALTNAKDDKMQLIKLSRASVPFPSHLKEYDNDEKEVLMKLKKLQVNSAESATSLKRLLKEKTGFEEEIKETMNNHYSTIIKYDPPPKEKDTGSYTLPCKINDMCFDKALADIGASVSVMPYSTFTKRRLDKLAPTKLII